MQGEGDKIIKYNYFKTNKRRQNKQGAGDKQSVGSVSLFVMFHYVCCVAWSVHACMRASVHACMHTCVYACIRACVHATRLQKKLNASINTKKSFNQNLGKFLLKLFKCWLKFSGFDWSFLSFWLKLFQLLIEAFLVFIEVVSGFDWSVSRVLWGLTTWGPR